MMSWPTSNAADPEKPSLRKSLTVCQASSLCSLRLPKSFARPSAPNRGGLIFDGATLLLGRSSMVGFLTYISPHEVDRDQELRRLTGPKEIS
jgi:hypothetical protein